MQMSGEPEDPAAGCPTVKEFKTVLDDRRRGVGYSNAESATRARKMAWCIAEAIGDRIRGQLSKAESIAQHQDVRKNMLIVAMSCCGDSLQPFTCMSGIRVACGTTGYEVFCSFLSIARALAHVKEL